MRSVTIDAMVGPVRVRVEITGGTAEEQESVRCRIAGELGKKKKPRSTAVAKRAKKPCGC